MRRLFHHTSLRIAALAALACAALGPTTAGAGYRSPGIRPVNPLAACTTEEAWEVKRGVPEALIPLFAEPAKDEETALRAFVEGLLLRLATKDAEVRYFAEYTMWRALFSLKLTHLAHLRFNVMLATPPAPENQAFRLAAMQCLNQIHRVNPSLALLPGAAEAIEARPIDDMISPFASPKAPLRALRQTAFEALTGFAMAEIGKAAISKPPELKNELRILQGSGPFEWLIRGQLAANSSVDKKDMDDAVRFGLGFLRATEVPPGLKRYEEVVHLNLARIYYARGEYARSIQEYRKISNTSNYFASTLIELAWAQLMLRQYSESVGTAYNLVAGGLKATFAPDAPVVMSIAYFETCNYPQAYQGLRFFRKIYEKSYSWLRAWGEKQRAAPVNLYEATIAYIKQKNHSDLPTQVGSEFLRSPVLIANQQEINLIFDEKTAIRRYFGLLANMKEKLPSRPQQQGAQALRNTLTKFFSEAGAIEQNLVAQINGDLAQRAAQMVRGLNGSVENIQLVEIEIYNSAGEDMIMENARPGFKIEAKEARERMLKAKKPVGANQLDWGRFPAHEAENGKAEIWEDELGALKTDIVDLCQKK